MDLTLRPRSSREIVAILAAVAIGVGAAAWTDRCSDPQTLAWRGWVSDMECLAESAPVRAQEERVAGRIDEANYWRRRGALARSRLPVMREILAGHEARRRSAAWMRLLYHLGPRPTD